MKSPAILFYTSDFLTGCSNLTMEERGQYITLLCLQHQLGRIPEKSIKLNIPDVSEDVMRKFIIDEEGLYYNERMEEEIIKRNGFVESRYKNGYKGGRPKKTDIKKPSDKPNGKPKENLMVLHKDIHMGNHIGNENDNVNINKNKYYNNINLDNIFIEYLDIRKKMKAPNTERAIKLLQNKLEPFTDDIKIQMLEQSIVNGWKSVYEIKSFNNRKEVKVPEWLNKPTEEKEEIIYTEEEKRIRDDIIRGD